MEYLNSMNNWALLGMATGMFGITLIVDIVWTWWTRACNEKKTGQAVIASIFIYLLGGISVMGYTQAPWLILPAAAGAALGTYAGMKWL